jgi:hypothetical protein
MSKDSDQVFCLDISEEGGKTIYGIENLDKIDKAGVIDLPVIVDTIGQI